MSQRTHNLIILKDQSFTKNNVYIIVNKLSSSAAIIDPACDLCEITDAISRWNISLDKVLLTHSHEDHIRRVNDLVALYNCDVYISKMEADYYFYDCNNLQLFEDEDVLNVGDTRISCLLTPGHTAGSTCFLFHTFLRKNTIATIFLYAPLSLINSNTIHTLDIKTIFSKISNRRILIYICCAIVIIVFTFRKFSIFKNHFPGFGELFTIRSTIFRFTLLNFPPTGGRITLRSIYLSSVKFKQT